MSTKYCVAYKNEKTIEWAEKTGNMAGGWIRISAWICFDEARRLFDIRSAEYTNSMVAIFPSGENSETAWYDRRPRYLSNQNLFTKDAPISVALGGLINARESDWF